MFKCGKIKICMNNKYDPHVQMVNTERKDRKINLEIQNPCCVVQHNTSVKGVDMAFHLFQVSVKSEEHCYVVK
jgi:hypothetical protein